MDSLLISEQQRWQKAFEEEVEQHRQYFEWYKLSFGQFSLRCRIIMSVEPLPEGKQIYLPVYECFYRKSEDDEERCIGTVNTSVTIFDPITYCVVEVKLWVTRYNIVFNDSGLVHVDQDRWMDHCPTVYRAFHCLTNIFELDINGLLYT